MHSFQFEHQSMLNEVKWNFHIHDWMHQKHIAVVAVYKNKQQRNSFNHTQY